MTASASAGSSNDASDLLSRNKAKINKPVEEREKELQGLARLKKEATEAVQSYQREEKQALNEEPERREMLGALSAEFPHIYFGAKANVGRDVAQKDGGLDS